MLSNLFASNGSLGVGQFASGTSLVTAEAASPNAHLIYDSSAGNLYYDADGNGAGQAVELLTLGSSTTHPALTELDFHHI